MDRERAARRAKELLDDPVLTGALQAIEDTALENLVRAPLWRMDRYRRSQVERIKIIRELRSELELAIIAQVQADRPRGSV